MPKAYSYVRLSSDTQKRGDGFRRQIEQSRQYALRHGLELDESFVQPNRAESAFRGDNATTGQLGRFLDACEKGQIEAGSHLLVESLDRLSRQDVFRSLALFMRLMTAGITIVTLIDERKYSIATSNEQDVLVMLGVMGRAHDESRTKSIRGRKNWEQKRSNIAEKKLTATAPAWLKLNRDKKSFTVIEGRAEIVRRIFDEALAGIGMYTITRRLNEDKIPTFSSSRGWHQSYVAKILTNPAVHGEFQPHYMDEDIRKPFGNPIVDYYPAIIDRETFFLAQGARHQRRTNGAGRKGSQVTNLFSGLVKCAYCEGAMRFENKGLGPKGGRYFVCEAALRKHDCEAIRWRYEEFEASFLALIKEVNLGTIFASKEQTSKRIEVESKIRSLKGELKSLERERDRAYGLLATTQLSNSYIQQRLDKCSRQIVEVEAAIEAAQRELKQTDSKSAANYGDHEELRRLIEMIRNETGPDMYKARAQIVSRLKEIVRGYIKLAPGGMAVERRREQRWLQNLRSNPPDDPELRAFAANPGSFGEINQFDLARCFSVAFQDGTRRIIYVSDDDPLSFEHQFYGSPDDELIWQFPTGEESKLRFIDEPKD